MGKYDYIVILASEIIKEGKEFKMPDFCNGVAQGGTMRLDAAVKMFKDKMVENIIVVGGKVRDSSTEKAETMADYLIKKGIPKEKITKLYSEANTRGNAIAVKYFVKEKKLMTSKFGLLSSFYHLPRAMKFFIKENIAPEPVIAEAILLDHPDYGVGKIERFLTSAEMSKRIGQEIEGLNKLEKGDYKPKTS